ncbi:MAG: tRNA preQ1(34) S-adenosylmethionine ribosyltransferase-isomerase QueA [Candidatus Buchananbacteria bacterium]|nr:tRNA preQ1(34) S-adenosylmethionine ribosyltransferase-isomerase QueA [Candidatus Buchananbacteria bacterium]
MFETILKKYDYQIPKDLIAQKPVTPRDAARLLVYEKLTKKIVDSTFKNLADFIPTNAVLVFNETKVIPARVETVKANGVKVIVSYVERKGKLIKVMLNKNVKVGDKLFLTRKTYFTVKKVDDKFFWLSCSFVLSGLNDIFEKYGRAPLPPYIDASPLSVKQARAEYQTVFAKTPGSIAAPTASLHFTKSLLRKLKAKGVTLQYVTLHVGLGTFALLTDENFKRNKLHEEWYSIDHQTANILAKAKAQNRPIIAVGTTVVRTLESAFNQRGKITKPKGSTALFIREGYKFKVVNALITNFHVPKSSLLMLVCAFGKRSEILKLYQHAIKKRYRLFSFGDGMLIK